MRNVISQKYNTSRCFHNLQYEQSLWSKGIELIAGVDEVGRGALAGPMIVCAVILKAHDLKILSEHFPNDRISNKNINKQTSILSTILSKNSQTKHAQIDFTYTKTAKTGNYDKSGTFINNDVSLHKNQVIQKTLIYSQIKDSKLLSPKKREELSDFIIKNCVSYSIYQISNNEIDTYGISKCTQKAFYQAVKLLKTPPEHILTDAFSILDFPKTIQTNIKWGDKVSLTISAASIVAKVYRDNLMRDLSNKPEYSVYDFAKHKGYGTKLHLEKIRKNGISPIHRHTFIHI